MSRVLNVHLHELAAAHLPPICAATGRQQPEDRIAMRELYLIKAEWGWFLCALVGGPFIFALLQIFVPRRQVRLPVGAAIAAAINTTNRQGLLLTRLGYLAFVVLLLPWFGKAYPLMSALAGFGWLAGLVGVYRLCRQSRSLPALVEIFAADRVALELPTWWIADEYRVALGHQPQGQPDSEQSQREEDALWETRANLGSWDGAPRPAAADPADPANAVAEAAEPTGGAAASARAAPAAHKSDDGDRTSAQS